MTALTICVVFFFGYWLGYYVRGASWANKSLVDLSEAWRRRSKR